MASTLTGPSAAVGPSTVSVDGLSRRFGGVPVLRDVSLQVGAGRMVALLGPSGCGKTTLLRVIAGLETPDAGVVRVGDRTLTAAAGPSAPAVFVPPERRRVGMVFQDWALFPHLAVAANVGYGLPRAERHGDRVERALSMVGLAGLGGRAPATLSGGQQQRVALARAIAPEPSVLLLDEPFSNLDTTLRVQVRTEVHQLLVDLGITTIFVTHDQDEAFVLGDEVAVMHEGRIVQQASPAALYAAPATPWVATFVGDANLLDANGTGDRATTPLGAVALAEPREGPVRVLLRPEEVRLDAGGDATVELVEFYGHDTVYVVGLPDGRSLRARAGSAPQYGRGERVRLSYAGPPTIAYDRA